MASPHAFILGQLIYLNTCIIVLLQLAHNPYTPTLSIEETFNGQCKRCKGTTSLVVLLFFCFNGTGESKLRFHTCKAGARYDISGVIENKYA